MKECIKCGEVTDSGERICKKCGSTKFIMGKDSETVHCPSCGMHNHKDEVVCESCGEKLQN